MYRCNACDQRFMRQQNLTLHTRRYCPVVRGEGAPQGPRKKNKTGRPGAGAGAPPAGGPGGEETMATAGGTGARAAGGGGPVGGDDERQAGGAEAGPPPGDMDETEGCQAAVFVSNFIAKFCIVYLVCNLCSKFIFMSESAVSDGRKDGNAQHNRR